jgi:hypothetical protein
MAMTSAAAGADRRAFEVRPEQDHARTLLERHGISVARVVAVDVDSVLYVDTAGEARTAWLLLGDDLRLTVRDEPGFGVDPLIAARCA